MTNPRPHSQPLPISSPASNYYMNKSKKTSGFFKKKFKPKAPLLYTPFLLLLLLFLQTDSLGIHKYLKFLESCVEIWGS